MNKGYCIILLTLLMVSSGEHDRFNKNIFRSPIDFPISLSGSFGDYRTNHFHSGIDIRTQGVTGKKVYAIAQGWISRIRISPYGYGLAVYIDHPQGYTSLYGHLKSFNKEISDYIRAKQYELQLNEIDCYLEKDEIKVNKGDIIAFSGNSGSSSGPHIHFEIRDINNQHPLNPLYFGFDVPDDIAPDAYHIRIYPLDPWSMVNGASESQNFPLLKSDNTYIVKDQIMVSGRIGVGIYSLDRFTNGKYKHCFNSLSMRIDGIETYKFRYEEFDFETLRDVNSHMDYELKLDKNQKVTKCFKEPFSRLNFYDIAVNNGVIQLINNEKAKVAIELKDNFNNKTEIRFDLTGISNEIRPGTNILFSKKLEAFKENVYRDESLTLFFPQNRLYKDVFLHVEKKFESDFSSDIYSILPKSTALKDWYTIKVKCDTSGINDPTKLAIGALRSNKKIRLFPSEFKNGHIQAQVKEFGEFMVIEDDVSPSIKFVDLNINTKDLYLKVTDNFEQIEEYEARVNGKWLRLYYDRKKDLLSANLSELGLNSGEYLLEVFAIDGQKNVGTLSLNIEI